MMKLTEFQLCQQHTYPFSWASSMKHRQLSLTYSPWTWHLQLCVVFIATQVSYSQLHSIASQGFLARTPARTCIAWPQLLSKAVEEDSNSSVLSSSCLQNQNHMDDTAKSFCSSSWNLSLISHSCTRFYVLTLEKHSPRQLLLKTRKLPQLDYQLITSSFIINLYHYKLEHSLCGVLPSRLNSYWG